MRRHAGVAGVLRGGTAVALATLALAAGAARAADTVRVEAAHLRFSVPSTWVRVPAPGGADAARYRLPAAAGDQAETELVLRTPDSGNPGTDKLGEEQVSRWADRFKQPGGQAARAVLTRTIDGLRVTRADVRGTYVGSSGGAVQAGVSGYRLLGAVVEGDEGPWIFEVLGPERTVAEARADFDALLFSLELHR